MARGMEMFAGFWVCLSATADSLRTSVYSNPESADYHEHFRLECTTNLIRHFSWEPPRSYTIRIPRGTAVAAVNTSYFRNVCSIQRALLDCEHIWQDGCAVRVSRQNIECVMGTHSTECRWACRQYLEKNIQIPSRHARLFFYILGGQCVQMLMHFLLNNVKNYILRIIMQLI